MLLLNIRGKGQSNPVYMAVAVSRSQRAQSLSLNLFFSIRLACQAKNVRIYVAETFLQLAPHMRHLARESIKL